MRSSRNKGTNLDTLAECEQSPPRNRDSISAKASQSGFSSFFGRAKNNKSSTPLLKIANTELNTTEVDIEPHKSPRRNSLASKHYTAMSRSMNDLGGLFIGNQSGTASTMNALNLSSSVSLLTSTATSSPGRSPSKKPPTSVNEAHPFPPETIRKQGWLNKRGSKKEASMKLHRVFVRLIDYPFQSSHTNVYSFVTPSCTLIRLPKS